MQVIAQNDYETMPWKNGQGTTREVHCVRADNKLVWRLSLAAVKADGPFSRFEGLERILTVIQGQGLRLVSPDAEIAALPFQPVRFSGETEIMGYCLDGPIEDFNLIYDPDRIVAEMRVVSGLSSADLICTTDTTYAVHLLEGTLSLGPDASATAGDTCLLRHEVPDVSASPDLRCILVSLMQR
ncbi:MAG: HutD family protein [Pseudodonghicola sp.]|nr:HutD family protein [Pseudodonghicola sp.]